MATRTIEWRHAAALVCGLILAWPAAAQIGIFEGHNDVGTVLHPGSAHYDEATHAYTVSGSGENMWFTTDALHFVWKKVSGNATLSATIAFQGTGGNAHRKAVLMFRQSLDADSAYADAARHGEGLTSLQSRQEKGATTHEIQANISAPQRLMLVKRGADIFMFLAQEGEPWRPAGGSMRVPLEDPYYVGIGVCAHDKDVVETAMFTSVELSASAPAGSQEYSTVEIVPVASTDRRAIYAASKKIEAARWADASTLAFKTQGKFWSVPLAGGSPTLASGIEAKASGGDFIYYTEKNHGATQVWRKHADSTGAEQITPDEYNSAEPHASPDGTQLAFLSFDKSLANLPKSGDVVLRVMTLADRKVKVIAHFRGGKGTLDGACWSPDNKRLVYVSHQSMPKLKWARFSGRPITSR